MCNSNLRRRFHNDCDPCCDKDKFRDCDFDKRHDCFDPCDRKDFDDLRCHKSWRCGFDSCDRNDGCDNKCRCFNRRPFSCCCLALLCCCFRKWC
ncbi:MAG: hypothetical protein ACOX3U_05110 [Christensenellales bacterium]